MRSFLTSPLLSLLALLVAGGDAHALQNKYVQQAENPFDNNGDGLPDLSMAPETDAQEKHFAEMAKAFGEASMTDSDLSAGQQARQFAFGQLREVVSGEVNQQVESSLSPWVTPPSI